MTLQVADRVWDTTLTNGTGTLTLANSPPVTFQSFGSVCSDGDTVYYALAGRTTNVWEVGLGTYAASGPQLARTTVLASSNGGSAVTLSGLTDVTGVWPAYQLRSIALIDRGTISSGTVTFNVGKATKQKLTVGGAITIAFTNWPISGTYAEIEIQLVNAGTNVTWPTVNWLVGDGTNSTNFSALGVTLYATGTNWIVVWSTDGGTTLYGRAA